MRNDRPRIRPDAERLTADVWRQMGSVRRKLQDLGALGPFRGVPAAAPSKGAIPRADRTGITVVPGWGGGGAGPDASRPPPDSRGCR